MEVLNPARTAALGHVAVPTLPPSFPGDCADALERCIGVLNARMSRNRLKRRYYEGKNRLKDFGISTPPTLLDVSTTVGWPQKAVDMLAVRSRFDGFTAEDPDVQRALDALSAASRLPLKYRQAVTNELINSCCFATVGVDKFGEPRIDLHSAETAAAVWDDAKGRIAYGIAVESWDADGAPDSIILDMEWCRARVWRSAGSRTWSYSIEPHAMGRPCMESFAFRPSYYKPFGQSRITRAVMDLTDSAVRVALGGDVAYQFSVSPQKYLLGADRDTFSGQTKWEAYIGNILALGVNAEGDKPTFGQLSQGSMQQTVEYFRVLAGRFSGETNVPLSALGIVSDNPSSAEAIYAANEPLIIECEDLNEGNGFTLRSLALMCLAAKLDVPLAELPGNVRDFTVGFKNPAMPSVVSQADAMVKIASVVPQFAGTDTFFEQMGFDEATRRRAMSDMERNVGGFVLSQVMGDGGAVL